MARPPNITQLLLSWRDGDQAALDALMPLVQQELHRLAARNMADERAGHLLQATALLNEAYVRLVDWKDVRWQNRAHFFAMAAQIMRRVLVDMARARGRESAGAVRSMSLSRTLATSRSSSDPRSWRWTRRSPASRRSTRGSAA